LPVFTVVFIVFSTVLAKNTFCRGKNPTLIRNIDSTKTITIRTRKVSKHQKLCDSETIFNIKPFNAIWSQITWQVKTEVRLTLSYNLYVICSEHRVHYKYYKLAAAYVN